MLSPRNAGDSSMFRANDSYGSYGSPVLRHPDGSINFDAYRAIAHRERQAAIASLVEGAARATNALLLAFGAVLAGRAAKHPPHHAR
jgi:hypothetical protein